MATRGGSGKGKRPQGPKRRGKRPGSPPKRRRRRPESPPKRRRRRRTTIRKMTG